MDYYEGGMLLREAANSARRNDGDAGSGLKSSPASEIRLWSSEKLLQGMGAACIEEVPFHAYLDPERLKKVLKDLLPDATEEAVRRLEKELREDVERRYCELDFALFELNFGHLVALVRALGITTLEGFCHVLEAIVRQGENTSEDERKEQQRASEFNPNVLAALHRSRGAPLNVQKTQDTEALRCLLAQKGLAKVHLLLKRKLYEATIKPLPKRRVACRVHNLIEFPKWIFRTIIDTPEFQRLRRIKQLGACWMVYPQATHTRLEHSLGVGHLARSFWDTLVEAANPATTPRGPKGVSDRELLSIGDCLTIAGLCHDLGHGPFSHTFESRFINQPGRYSTEGGRWCHEDMSIRLFHKICDGSEHLDETDKKMIQRMILGDVPRGGLSYCDDTIESFRRASYTVVANKESGIDVDRFDYLQRDAYVADNLPSFRPRRIMEFARIVDGEICFAEKEARNVMDMFTARYRMFQEVYRHRKVCAIEAMICDILEAIDPVLNIRGKVDGTTDDFLTLDDAVFNTGVRFFQSQKRFGLDGDEAQWLQRASQILDRLDRRDVYRFAGEMQVTGPVDEVDTIRQHFTVEKLLGCRKTVQLFDETEGLRAADVILDWSEASHGTGRRNPMDTVSFFDPSTPERRLLWLRCRDRWSPYTPVRCVETDRFKGKYRMESHVQRAWLTEGPRVYCRRREVTDALQQTFVRWQDEYVPRQNRGVMVRGFEAYPTSFQMCSWNCGKIAIHGL